MTIFIAIKLLVTLEKNNQEQYFDYPKNLKTSPTPK